MRQTAQQALILTRQIRETANRSKELDVFLRACARQIKDCLACEAVGIRVMNENGMIPFRAHEGFDESFYQRESPLSIHADRCLCISVVKGILDSAQPFATPGGSFCVSGLTGFHASTPVQTTGPMRKACNRAGFETLALVPIRAEGRILGLIHLADRRANLSARQWVETLEEAGPELGAAIRRFRSEQASVSPHEPIESDGDGRAPDPDSHAEIDKERKEAERALQAVKQELADLIEYSAIGVFRSTAEGRFTLVNPAMAHMFGYDSPEQMLAEIHDIEHQIYANPADREEMIRRIRSENAQQSTFETRFRRRDGTQWDANLHIRIISEEPGRSLRFEGFIEDITEQKKGQQALLQTSRMEATATLAGGIAHDFNNLMVAVLGNAELLKDAIPSDAEAQQELNSIIAAAQRAGDLAHQILAYARGGKYQPRAMNLRQTILSVIALQERSIPAQIEIHPVIGEDLWEIHADPAQMSQVVMNLCLNAVEAIEGKGRVKVRADNVPVREDAEQPGGTLKAGRYVRLTVEDNGCGISEEIQARVFEPFFTTKFQGRGLGLAAVYGIVHNHGGQIELESQLGRGSRFTIWLPTVAEAQSRDAGAQSPASPKWKETVLLVDDEELVLSVGENMLKRLGYRVLVARNGQEAVDIARDYPEEIHLALLDIGMPAMSGLDSFPLLRQARGDRMKIVLCSGYDLESEAEWCLQAGAAGFVQKPFRMAELSQIIHTVLDQTDEENSASEEPSA